jgi:hypothetical protein
MFIDLSYCTQRMEVGPMACGFVEHCNVLSYVIETACLPKPLNCLANPRVYSANEAVCDASDILSRLFITSGD